MELRRALVVVNPVARSGRAPRVWQRAHVGAGVDSSSMACIATTAPGDARCLAREAARTGFERVIAVGGDGTVSEVADGLAGSRTALGVIPAGTGDDFARAMGVPPTPEASARLAFHGSPRRVDLGQITVGGSTSAFVNVAGCGFDAEVVRRTRRSSRRRLGGTLTYLLGVFQTLWLYRPRDMRLAVDGRWLERRVLGLAAANGASYGGGMRIAPGALIDDGLLDVCVIGDVSPMRLLALLPRLYTGTHVGLRDVELFRCKELRVEPAGPGETACQADGEPLGPTPSTFGIQSGALWCVTAPAVA